MEYAIDYTKKRRAFGTKIANFQAIQHKIAEMYQKVETSRLLVWKAGWRCRICGHVHYGDEAPDECPYCFFPKTAFKRV